MNIANLIHYMEESLDEFSIGFKVVDGCMQYSVKEVIEGRANIEHYNSIEDLLDSLDFDDVEEDLL